MSGSQFDAVDEVLRRDSVVYVRIGILNQHVQILNAHMGVKCNRVLLCNVFTVTNGGKPVCDGALFGGQCAEGLPT